MTVIFKARNRTDFVSFSLVSLVFFIIFVVIVLLSQVQTSFYHNYDLFIKVKGFKSILCLFSLFYISFLFKSQLGAVFSRNKFSWHLPVLLALHLIEATAASLFDNPFYWRVVSYITLLLSAVFVFSYMYSQVGRVKKEWLINVVIGSGLILSSIYAFSLNINYQSMGEYNWFLWSLMSLAASVLIMCSLILLTSVYRTNNEMHGIPLVIAIIALFEIVGRDGFVVWWGAVLLHLFLFYLLIAAVARVNKSVARIMNMYQQGLNTNSTAYFCGSLEGQILFANQSYRRLVGVKLGAHNNEIPNVMIDHPLWPEIKERFCTRGYYKAETVINPIKQAPISVAIHMKPLPPENDWYQVSITDLQSRIEIQQKRDIALEKLEQLSKDLMEKQEEERRYFAKELHDEIGQGLTLLKIQHQLPNPDFELINNVLSELLDSVRNLSLNLRPSILDDMGLSLALSWLADRQVKFSKLHIETDIIQDLPRMPEKLEISIFRIAQEAFTNIHKYAKATRVRLELHLTNNDIELIVIDDGIGFDVDAKLNDAIKSQSLGLVSIRERAFTINGKLTIDSTPEMGTSIRLVVPFVGKEEAK